MSDSLRSGIIRLAHEHPEFHKDLLPLLKEAAKPKRYWVKGSLKEASGTSLVRRMMMIRVRVVGERDMGDGTVEIRGMIAMQLGDQDAAPLRFTALVDTSTDPYTALSFSPLKAVSGMGADQLEEVYRTALDEALSQDGSRLVRGSYVAEAELGI